MAHSFKTLSRLAPTAALGLLCLGILLPLTGQTDSPPSNPSSTQGDLDSDDDGWSNQQEAELGTDPGKQDTDDDGVNDPLDGWPQDRNLTHKRVAESYALVDLSDQLTYPTTNTGYYKTSVQVDDRGSVLLAHEHSESYFSDTTTYATHYYDWNLKLSPPAFNAVLETGQSYEDGYAEASYTVHLTRSGVIHFEGWSLFDEQIYDTASNLIESRAFHEPFNSTFDTSTASSGKFTDLDKAFNAGNTLVGDLSNEHTVTLMGLEYSEERLAMISKFAGIYSEASTIQNDHSVDVSMINNEVHSIGFKNHLYNETISLYRSVSSTIVNAGRYSGRLTRETPAYSYAPAWVLFPFTYVEPYYPTSELHWNGVVTEGDTVHSALGQDIVVDTSNATAHRYSLDGSTFHDFKVWNPISVQLESAEFLKTSDNLVMLLDNSNIVINQQKKAISELLSNPEGWSDFSLHDINSHGMIVGTAQNNGSTKVIALLKVDMEEVWSNQFSGIEVNKLPGQSGHQGRPYLTSGGEEYLIVGPKSGTNTISLKVKFDAPDTPGLQDKIKFKILPSSSPVDAYHASPTTTSIDWSTKIATVEYELNILDENLYEGYETELSLLMYLDLDGNDQIDSPSDVAVNSELSNGDTFHLKFVFSNNYLNAAILGYFGGVFGGLNDWPDAANMLNAFATGNVPNGAVDLNTTITTSGDRPSHNNGVVFDNSGSGPSSNYVFDALSDMSERVLDSADVTRHVRDVLDSNYDAVVAAFAQPGNENETFLVLSFPISSFDERIGFFIDGNLHRTFGTANISGTVEAVVNKLAGSEGNVYQVDVVSVDANVTDLYDWDYDKGGNYDKPFALMQGGFDTIAPGGQIFKLRTRLDGHISDFQHFINPIED